MVRNLAFILFMFLPLTTHAQLESQFTFHGQNAEVLHAEKAITISTPVSRQVPSTCSRQVPDGEEEDCRNETRYRESCQWIPSSERCSTENERVCRSVPRTRQECSTGPSRQVCHENPSRQVCHDRPTREICHTNPNGQQSCTTVGGGTACETVGGGTTCSTVPGERECRMVTYTDEDCDYVPRQRCETVPGRNDCTSIPYSEVVCRTQTRYRTETYACTRTQTDIQVTQKQLKAETNVQVITNGLVEEFPMTVSIKETSSNYSAFAIEAKLVKEPKLFVVLKKKEVKVASATDKEIQVKGTVILEVLTKEMLPIAFPASISQTIMDSETKKLLVVFEGPISSQGNVDLNLSYRGIFSTYKVADLKEEYPSKKIELGSCENKAALNIDLTQALVGSLKKNMKLRLTLSAPLNLQGELMNTTKPESTKLYEGVPVQLK